MQRFVMFVRRVWILPESREHLLGHLVLLVLFACGVMGLWMLPVLFTGRAEDISPLLFAHNFAATDLFSITDAIGRFLSPALLPEIGVTSAADGRLSTILIAFFSQWIAWDHLVGWSTLGAAVMAAALIPLWFAAKKVGGTRIAWVTVVLVALMPYYWRTAIFLDNYNFAFFFLFTAFAAFLWIRPRSEMAALAIAGALFGLCALAKDTFLILLPWTVLAYAWSKRANWKRAAGHVAVFVVCIGVVYMLPYIGDIQKHGYPMNLNLARLWPGAEDIAHDNYLHIYPDPYTYYFDRDGFKERLLAWISELTPLEQRQQQKGLIAYDLVDPGFFGWVVNGTWILLGNIPSLFQQDKIGGAALWLFIIPGLLYLWYQNRKLLMFLLGLVLSSELIIRFILHYARDHYMDTAWIFAFLGAVGVALVADTLALSWRRFPAFAITALIALLVGAQLLQANRAMFARVYAQGYVDDTMSLSSAVRALPEDAVVATSLHPNRIEYLTFLSDRTIALFRSDTVDLLLTNGKLREVFEQYGVTHVARYPEDVTRRMKAAMPTLTIVENDAIGPQSPPVSTFLRFLLHKIQ